MNAIKSWGLIDLSHEIEAATKRELRNKARAYLSIKLAARTLGASISARVSRASQSCGAGSGRFARLEALSKA